MDTTKNSYTLIYMAILVVVVSLLLSITSGALKSRQNDNIKLDKKKQILYSLPSINVADGDAVALYESTIKEFNILDVAGNVIKTLNPMTDFDYKAAEGELPIYVAKIDGARKYIIPMNGKGLWGAIWGYIALDDDRNTIHGIYFAHSSETPGLGSNIVDPGFRDPFKGKKLLKDGKFASIAVMKTGQKAVNQEQVDALSGGTVTSKGVESMLQTSLVNYANFFTAANKNVVDKEVVGCETPTDKIDVPNNKGEN